MEIDGLQSNISKLSEFYSDEKQNVCLIEGKQGSFKTKTFNESLCFTGDKTLVFKFKCFEGTTLDDIFLAFLEDLKKYSQQKKVSVSKIETNSISQRINHYLTHITNPVIILIDSLENIFNKKNETEKEEILNYVQHLTSMNKFKIVLISRYFDNKKIAFNNPLILTSEIFDEEKNRKYFASMKIQNSDADEKKFFEITNGNVNNIVITSILLQSLNITLGSLINDFESKKVSFDDFLIQKLLAFVPEKVKNSLYHLSMMNEGLTAEYLANSGYFTKEQINYFFEKKVIMQEYGYVFLKSNLKNYLQSYIPHYEKLRIHGFWKSFYESELPVQPNKRTILISRNTMRAQIAYHNSFLPQETHSKSEKADLSLMSYLNSNLTDWNIKNTNTEKEEKPKNKTDLEKYELTKDELSLLSVPFDLNKKDETDKKEITFRTFEQNEDEKTFHKEQTLKDIFEIAEAMETSHNFDSAVLLFEKAYLMQTDPEFAKYEPLLLQKLAECSKKLNEMSQAIEYYNKLVDYYEKHNDPEKFNETRLEIARIYKETYKINHARVIYENFIGKNSTASNNIQAISYIALAEIEEESSNTDKAIEYYKKSFSLACEITDKNTLSEGYFKYALILDDSNQTQAALDFYQKSIQASSTGKYYSSAFTNIGEIIKEQGSPAKAIEYFKRGLKADLEQSNHEGIYYICLKLAQTNDMINSDSVLDWLLKGLSAAKRTKEKIYIENAYVEIGNYYFNAQENEKALKSFLLAKQNSKEEFGDNAQETEDKLLKLKAKMNVNTYNKIVGEYSKNEA